MKTADYIIARLAKAGYNRCWLVQGGAIAHVIDAAYRRESTHGDFRSFVVQHEQSAGFAADAYTRIDPDRGKAVVMATSGPGATNLMTAIAANWYDGVPVVYLTGQVRTWERSEGGQRQKGFQETDVVSMVKDITKYAVRVDQVTEVQAVLERALMLANTGRPGPVLVDLPMNIQWEQISALVSNPSTPVCRSEKIDLHPWLNDFNDHGDRAL